MNESIIDIAIDAGFGEVKAHDSRGRRAEFGSVWGIAPDSDYEGDDLDTRYPHQRIFDGPVEWWIGDLASQLLPADQQMHLFGRTADEIHTGTNEARMRLIKAAISALYRNVTNGGVYPMRIATGLPVSHMSGRDAFKAQLIGTHPIQTNGCDFVADIQDVTVIPQPAGTGYKHLITKTGELDTTFTMKRIGIVDVGRVTTDLALLNQGAFISAQSGSIQRAVNVIQSAIESEYMRRFGDKPSQAMVDNILRHRKASVFGQEEQFTVEIENASQALTEAVLSLMNEKWGVGSEIETIFLTGGGSYFMTPKLRESFPHVQRVKNPVMSNVDGYLRFSLFRRAQAG